MKVKVVVELKNGVLDPQGQAIQRSLQKMGYKEVLSVRQGKYFELEFKDEDPQTIRTLTGKIARDVLSNPIIETFSVEEPE